MSFSHPIMRELTQLDMDRLACPNCRKSLALEHTFESKPHRIVCTGCKRVFPIVNGLPVLIWDKSSLYKYPD